MRIGDGRQGDQTGAFRKKKVRQIIRLLMKRTRHSVGGYEEEKRHGDDHELPQRVEQGVLVANHMAHYDFQREKAAQPIETGEKGGFCTERVRFYPKQEKKSEYGIDQDAVKHGNLLNIMKA